MKRFELKGIVQFILIQKIILREDIDEKLSPGMKKFVFDFETLFLSVCVSSKLKKKHLKKLFKATLKYFNEWSKYKSAW